MEKYKKIREFLKDPMHHPLDPQVKIQCHLSTWAGTGRREPSGREAKGGKVAPGLALPGIASYHHHHLVLWGHVYTPQGGGGGIVAPSLIHATLQQGVEIKSEFCRPPTVSCFNMVNTHQNAHTWDLTWLLKSTFKYLSAKSLFSQGVNLYFNHNSFKCLGLINMRNPSEVVTVI